MHLLLALLVALAQTTETPDESGDEGPEEAESATAQPVSPELLYTRDLTDEQLARQFKEDLASVGSISVGFADRGRMINAVHMPADPAWRCERPDLSWGASETIEALALVLRAVHSEFPDSAPGRISHISARDGGYLRPHRSHQSGRDADIGLFYKNDAFPGRVAHRERFVDLPRNWALLRELITQTDVQMIPGPLHPEGAARVRHLAGRESGVAFEGVLAGGEARAEPQGPLPRALLCAALAGVGTAHPAAVGDAARPEPRGARGQARQYAGRDRGAVQDQRGGDQEGQPPGTAHHHPSPRTASGHSATRAVHQLPAAAARHGAGEVLAAGGGADGELDGGHQPRDGDGGVIPNRSPNSNSNTAPAGKSFAYAIARGECCEAAAALDIACVAGRCTEGPARAGGVHARAVYSLFCGLMRRPC